MAETEKISNLSIVNSTNIISIVYLCKERNTNYNYTYRYVNIQTVILIFLS